MFNKLIKFVRTVLNVDKSDEKPRSVDPRKQPRKPSPRRRPEQNETSTASASRDQERRSRKRRPARNRDQDKPEKPAKAKPAKEWHISEFKVPPAEGKKRFHDLNLPDSIMHAIADQGFQYCTPIQAEILESTLAGRDASGQAQTGTGKTAAFLITIFTRLLRDPVQGKRERGKPRALILAPTRELVLQIAKDAEGLGKYTDLRIQTIFGGMDYRKQKTQVEERVADVIVATPGRLLDFLGQRILKLDEVEIMVIDEADRMLDMGFIPDVRKIIRQTPPKEKRQTLFFSATLTDDVERLSQSWTREAVIVEIEPERVAAESVEQVVYIVTTDKKFALLYNIITRRNLERVLIFCNRRDETRKLTNKLRRYNIGCEILSGDIPQRKRVRTLDDFKAGKIRVLVATDVAGRGIHIEDMDHVINYTLPSDPEDYVHRIGRTGRAGASGTSISFACEEGGFQLPAIIDFLGHELPCTQPEEEWLKIGPPPPLSENDQEQIADPRDRSRSGGRSGRSRSGGRHSGSGGRSRSGRSGGGSSHRSSSSEQTGDQPAAASAPAESSKAEKPDAADKPKKSRRPRRKRKKSENNPEESK